MEFHEPVLLNEVLDILHIQPGKTYLDGTLGNAGHTLEILKRGGIVYGVDQDETNLKIAASRIQEEGFGDRFEFIKGNFGDLPPLLSPLSNIRFDGVLLDLGLSSGQLKSEGRGFSFNDSKSLDMRLDQNSEEITAESIINTSPFEELVDIFSYYAQEKFSKPLAIRIIKQRQHHPIKTASELAEIIRKFYTDRGVRLRTDPATKIFMALRIAVNREYENLKKFLELTTADNHFSHSTIAIITFHSGEDRIVKQFIRASKLSGKIQDLTPKAVAPSRQEILKNPLSRSALLRSYKVL